MQCPTDSNETAGLLLDYCAGRLDTRRNSMFESHLAGCGSCRELVRAQRELWDSLDSWNETEVSHDFNRKLYARIEVEQRRWFAEQWWNAAITRVSLISWWPAVPATLACIAMVAATWMFWPEAIKSRVDTPQAKVDSVEAEQVERTLQDLEMLKQLHPKVPAEGANATGSM